MQQERNPPPYGLRYILYSALLAIMCCVYLRRFTKAIITLRNMAKRHALSELYQDTESKERIANMYFPYIIVVCIAPVN